MSEHLLQEGAIDSIPVIDLMVSAMSAAGFVRLELARGGARRSFSFSESKLTRIDASGSAASLTAMLVKRGRLSEADADRLKSEAEASDKHIIDVLVTGAGLSAEDLKTECALWATLLIVQSVGWSDGTYRIFSTGPTEPAGDLPLDIATASALLKGVYKRVELSEIKAMLAPYGEALPVQVFGGSISTSDLDLDARQLSFVDSLDGKRSITDVLAFSSLDESDSERMLYALHRLEIIRFNDPNLGGVSTSASAHDDAGGMTTSVRDPEPAAPVDMSAFSFKRGGSGSAKSATFHSARGSSRESIQSTRSGPVAVDVGFGRSDDNERAATSLQRESSLSGLFDGMDLEPSPSPILSSPPPPPPSSTPENGSETGRSPITPPASTPPPAAENDELAGLTTRDKERVQQLRGELARLESANYFEYFQLSHESPDASLKKAYFQAAKRYHPDSLLDEPEAYRALAQELFGHFSEAWEVLSDAESRDKYTRKHIFGEKDENDLAMEQVQRVLDAEASFKQGTRLLNAGKPVDALRHFKAAHESYEEEGEYLAYYGLTLLRTSRNHNPEAADRAMAMLHQAAKLSPNSTKPSHFLGKAYLLRGEPAVAKKHLRKVLKKNADDPEAIRDYRRADELMGRSGSSSSVENTEKKGGFFSRFSRKKVEPPKKREGQDFVDNLDIDLDF